MTDQQETPPSETPEVDPEESPFKTPPIEGIPYERGSEEDRAIRRVIEEYESERREEAAKARV